MSLIARRTLVGALVAVVAVLLWPSAAAAHSLDSSTISVRVTDDSVNATISIAVETLDEALSTSYIDEPDVDVLAGEVVDYLDDHLTVTGSDGRVWTETYTDPVREEVEGIQSFSVEVRFDTDGTDPSDFTVAFSAIVEAIDGHEAVVVLTAADGSISTPGIIDSVDDRVDIGAGAGPVAVGDMIEYGFEHVLEGADHLLFMLTLLLPAPLVVRAGRWQRSGSPRATTVKLVHVITAFTIGHSLTLLVSALGWISVPSRPVEVLIAASVGVSAVHAIRPLAAKGEQIIAVAFGLVHGLAFAGILSDLGLTGTTSVLALLAFNIGIELAQLLAAALVFPSLWVLSTTRLAVPCRVVGASIALVAAVSWGADRVSLGDNPVASTEDAAIHNPWTVPIGLAVIAGIAWAAGSTTQRRPHGAEPSAHEIHHA